MTYVNWFLVEFAPFAEAMDHIALGELDTRPLLGRVIVVHSFNAHQSNLRHLTWKTQQIADGDKKSSQMAPPLFDCSEPQLPPLEDYLYYDVEPPEASLGEL